MANVGMTILYILLFLVCLGVLIVVHELGHLTAAKIFKVYCHEFSIGMGPKIFSRRRKGGETYFSLRWIPFGGFVSMYGEEESIPEGLNIDPSRSLNAIRRWKRAIIMVAGVAMNFVLAMILFFISNIAFEQKNVYVNVAAVTPSSQADIVFNIPNESIIVLPTDEESGQYVVVNNLYYLVDDDALITYNNGTESKKCAAVLSRSLKGYTDLTWSSYVHFFPISSQGVIDTSAESEFVALSIIDNVAYDVSYAVPNGDDLGPVSITKVHVTCESTGEEPNVVWKYKDYGLSMYLHAFWYSYGDAVVKSFKDFGDSSIAIFKGLGSLFTKEGFSQAGGIIAIGFESTNILKTLGFGKFLFLWGMISVNLGIVNLFPFPGLDGWHFLVIIVEGIFHKEIPQKVKTILSLVGLGLLIVLMVVLVFKDFFKYIV